MTNFKAPQEDILFAIQHVADAARLADYDHELYEAVIAHFARFAEEQIAPIDALGDEVGCVLADGRVQLPGEFKSVYQDYCEQAWPALSVPEAFDGQGLNALIVGVCTEIFTGACHSLQMVTGLVPGAVRTLLTFGTDTQQHAYIPKLASGSALATMCLTEPGAGSDLSLIRTRAEQVNGEWHINGEKCFISGGDQNISNEILHLVLARTGDASDGVKGLSLFLCRSDLEDGTRNSIAVERIESKMGLHASPTCHMVFNNTKAELLGEQGAGLLAMFTMMNHARLDVALQGVAHAAKSFAYASDYAANRKQGKSTDNKQTVSIDQHADVRRMLDEQRILALAARGLSYSALVTLELNDNTSLLEFLVPVCKVFCTEAGQRSADLGIQILGGYGYLQEYGLEQTYRDARIASIYEGANGIHSQGLVKRGIDFNSGDGINAFDEFVTQSCESEQQLALTTPLLEQWRDTVSVIKSSDDRSVFGHDFMQLSAWLACHAIWNRINHNADHAVDAAELHRLYPKASQLAKNKIAMAVSNIQDL